MGPLCVSAWVWISLWLTGYGYIWPHTLKIVPMPLLHNEDTSNCQSVINSIVQWNLSIMVTLGLDISGLYIQVAVIEKICIRWSAAF